jgi:peptidoglycan/LPS O-acetylase OafA/YrhL
LAPILRGSLQFEQHWQVYMLTPFRMDLLAAGALLCFAYRDKRPQIERFGAAAGALLTIAGLAGLLLLAHFGQSTDGNTRTGNVLIYECALLTCADFVLWP